MGEIQTPNIIEALESPKLFGPVIGNLSTWSHWQTFLRALYCIPFSGDDEAVFKQCTGRLEIPSKSFQEVYALCGRRAGKSKIASVIVAYESLFGNWQERLSPGERGWAFIVAIDKMQAKICLDYIRSLLKLFPDMIDREGSEEIHLRNNISISVKTCTFRGSRGYTIICAVCDELSFWRSEETAANPAADVIASLLPGMAENSKIVGISTPYSKNGFLWEMHKNYFGKDDSDILIWQAGTKFMNPTFSDSTIKRLCARDPSAMRAEFDATFREDIENFLPLDLLTACATGFPRFPDLKNKYFAFVDPSGGRQDSMTLGIAHAEGDKVILDRIQEQKSPFDPAIVVEEFSSEMKMYGIREVVVDRFGGVWVEDAFKKHGIKTIQSDISASDIYLEFLPLVTMSRVTLLDNERLLQQFQMLERRTQSGGRDRVDHPPGSHDDMANAAAGAVVFCARNKLVSLEDMEKFLPVKSEHHSPFAKERETALSMEEECRKAFRGNPIVRR